MKKYLSYFKELTIITLSVTIAFWVENFRESRKEYKDTQALLVTLKSELEGQKNYLHYLTEMAEKHSHRFDSLITDLNDCTVNNNQLLIDISLAYLPYIGDFSETSSFDALKNSALLSNIKSDTLIIEVYYLASNMKRNLKEYSESWKKSQDRVRNLLTIIYGGHIQYNFDKSKLMVIKNEPITLNKELCSQLAFELSSWITIMNQYSVPIKHNENEIKDAVLPILNRQIH
jgi:hypothetical protein